MTGFQLLSAFYFVRGTLKVIGLDTNADSIRAQQGYQPPGTCTH